MKVLVSAVAKSHNSNETVFANTFAGFYFILNLLRTMAQNGRLIKELNQVSKDDGSGVQAQPFSEGNLRHLKGTIQGPTGTPYEGGVFEIDIHIGKQYPFEPPKMKYTTKIWHPNISSQTGAICLVRAWATEIMMELTARLRVNLQGYPAIAFFLT